MARSGRIPYLLGDDFHSLAFVEFGNPAAEAVVCVHGLSRNGRDFDPLAEALAERFHVICPDLPGRGASEWLPEASLYQPASYVIALAHLLAHLAKPVHWVGTSLGGICGMMVAAAAHTPIRRLVLNDIGAKIPAAALARIREYMLKPPPRFATLAQLEAHLREVHAPFGDLTDAQWAHLARHSARPLADGGLALHYDPKIAEPLRAPISMDADLTSVWKKIRLPVLVIRGATSDLLTEDVFAAMQKDGARGLTVGDAGHAPALMDAPTIDSIRGFLEAPP